MKVFLNLIAIFIFVSFYLSCSPNAQKDFEAYEGIMRSELVRMDINKQNEIFGQMSPDQKVAIWKYKMQDILNDDRYSTEEKKEIEKFVDFLKPSVYTEEGNAEFQAFADNFEKTMMDKYGWDENKLIRALHVFMTTAEQNENLKLNYPEVYNLIMTGNAKIDNNIEKWAKNNQKHYSESPRSEFVKLKINQQDALYNQMSPDERASMWTYKSKDIKNNNSLSQEEKEILRKYYEQFTPEFFELKNSRQKEVEVRKEAYFSLSDLGWTKEKSNFYLDCLMTEKEFDDYCKNYKEYNLYISSYLR